MTVASTEELEALPEGTLVVVGAPGSGVKQWRRTSTGLEPVDGPAGSVPPALFRGYIASGHVQQEDGDREPQVGDLYVPANGRANPMYLITEVTEQDTTYKAYRRGSRVSSGAESRASKDTWRATGNMRRLHDIPEEMVSTHLTNDLYGMLARVANTTMPEPEVTETAIPVTVTVTGRSRLVTTRPPVTWVYAYTYTVTGKPEQCACSTLDREKVAAGLPPNTEQWDATASCPYG